MLLDGAGREVVRHGNAGFLGEVNLLSGQTVFLTAEVTKPLRYIAVEREKLRRLLYDDGAFSDLVLSAFVERREALQALDGIGLEIVGAARVARHAQAAGVRGPPASAIHAHRPCGGRRGGGVPAPERSRQRAASPTRRS